MAKKNIHPEYFDADVVCGGCGNTFQTGSVLKNIHVSICSKCHPFYTGNQKMVDTAGRVDKFNAKYAKFMEQSK